MASTTQQKEVEIELEDSSEKTVEDSNKNEVKLASELAYSIDDVPPWYLCILLGFQHYLTMFGATVAIPFVITPALCMEDNDPSRGYVISTLFFVSGLVTLIQATVGVRLPIIQGGTFSFFAPTFAILSLPHNKCPADGWGEDMTYEDKTEEWMKRMREVQGAIIVASLVQVIIGYFGIVGMVLRFITPLTIVPAVSMIGLALFDVAGDYAAKDWGVAMGTVICMTLFSQYLRNVSVPWVTYKKGKIQRCQVDVFKLFPVLMTILFMWLLCAIITASGGFAENSPARTDLKLDTLYSSQWIRIPYPCK